VLGNSISGVILAGGKSSRMGTDKALLPVKGIPLIRRVVDTLCSTFSSVYLITDHHEKYNFLGLPTIRDIHPDSGPLGGIHAALTTIDTDSVFVVGCDTPFVSKDLITYIVEYESAAAVRVAQEQRRIHPLCGVYTKACLPAVSARLASRQLTIMRFLEEVGYTAVPIAPDLPWYDSNLLLNINTPGDLPVDN
jgi:molybdopterin-guanine dinucleotide biosynthesis protein A